MRRRPSLASIAPMREARREIAYGILGELGVLSGEE